MARILIIDDEQSIRLSLSELLSDTGYEVFTAADCDSALKYVKKFEFDVIITDIIIPKMDGITLVKKILEIQPGTEVIFISGEPNLSTASAAIRIGAFDYLAKPIPFDILRRTVARAINVKQLSDEKKRLEIENQQYRNHLERLVKKRTKKLSDTNKILRYTIKQKTNAEKELQSSQKQLALIIDNLPAMVAYVDFSGHYRFVNKAYSDYFQVPQQIDGKIKITDVLGKNNYKKIKPYIDKVLTGAKVKFDDEINSKSGEKCHFHIEYIPQFDEFGKVVAYFILRQDMTKYYVTRDAAFQVERYKSLSNMASGIANEYNNMLTVCLGNITLTKNENHVTPIVYNRLLQMEDAVYSAKELTQQLFSFTQSGSSWRETFRLSDMINNILTFIKKKDDINFLVDLNDDAIQIRVNISQIIHVIHTMVNILVDNVPLKDTIHLSTKSLLISKADYLPLKRGMYVQINISANLEKSPSSYVTQIFSPFSKSDNIKNSMRMVAVYSIVQDHDGYLSVDDQNGSGTTFTLYLPVNPSDHYSGSVQKHFNAKGDYAIVMDDEENVGHVISDMLKYLGFEVTLLKEGDAVVNSYKKAFRNGQSFDVVLLDLFIPNGMGAKETNQKLLKIDPNIKSIIMSGFHDDPIMSNYTDYGFAGCLYKPFEIDQLENTISEIL